MILGLQFTTSARAQGPGALPRAGGAMEAYGAVEGWVRSMAPPAEPARVDPPGSAGACVTLRLSGVVIGRATRMGEDGFTVWRAAREAWSEAAPRLAGPEGLVRDAAAIEDAHDAAQRVTIDLQLAGALVPLPARPLDDLSMELSAGLDGVCARVGDRAEAVFPGTMLATNVHPGSALAASINALGLQRVGIGDPRVSLAAMRRDHGLALYRFGTQHLAQPAPGSPPLFLHRGGRVVSMSEMNPAALCALEDRLVEHLASRKWPGEEPFGLLGTYKPWMGAYEDSKPGAPDAQALAALALLRSAIVRAAEPAAARARLALAWSVLADLGEVAEGEADPSTDSATLSLLHACSVLLHEAETASGGAADAWSPELRERAKRACALGGADAERFNALFAEGDFQAALAPAEQALVAYAMALDATRPGAPAEARARAEAAVRKLLRDTGAGDLPNLMPWVGLAELRLAGEGAVAPSAVALRQFRELTQRHTLQPLDVGERDRDLTGGIVFTRARAPLPSWQTLRPLSFTCVMLGDERLTSQEEAPAELARLLPSLRFLAQLTAGDAEMHMFQSRERALGGVRMSLWDQRMPLETSALGLFTVTDAIEAIRRRS